MTNEALEFGKTSYARGLTIEANPFRGGTEEAKDFIKGWDSANKAAIQAATSAFKSAKRSSPNFHR